MLDAAADDYHLILANQGVDPISPLRSLAHRRLLHSRCTTGLIYAFRRPTGHFSGISQKDVQIEPNRQVRLDLTLKPGSVAMQITVTEAPAELQSESAEVNSEISQTEISQLPLTSSQGRSYQALYTLIPGGAAVGEQIPPPPTSRAPCWLTSTARSITATPPASTARSTTKAGCLTSSPTCRPRIRSRTSALPPTTSTPSRAKRAAHRSRSPPRPAGTTSMAAHGTITRVPD